MKMEKYGLSDNSVGHIAQLLQLAILTGTDIIDHLRMAELTINTTTNKLDLHPDYAENFTSNINRLMEEAASLVDENDVKSPAPPSGSPFKEPQDSSAGE